MLITSGLMSIKLGRKFVPDAKSLGYVRGGNPKRRSWRLKMQNTFPRRSLRFRSQRSLAGCWAKYSPMSHKVL